MASVLTDGQGCVIMCKHQRISVILLIHRTVLLERLNATDFIYMDTEGNKCTYGGRGGTNMSSEFRPRPKLFRNWIVTLLESARTY